MPIRHCQKCGLKVLIDESQTAANPFYCQRCAVSANMSAAPVSESPAPAEPSPESPAPRQDTASVLRQSLESRPKGGGPVKVLCPYCKASFSGRLPAKPAKGACPVCQKELVLLPDGKIRPAANFDLAKWQKEQEMLRYGGDPGMAEQAKAVQRALEGSSTEPPPQQPQDQDFATPAPDPIASAMENPKAAPSTDMTMMPMPQGMGGVGSDTMLDMARPDVTRTTDATLVPTMPSSDAMGGIGGETMLDMGRPESAAPPPTENPLADLADQPPADESHPEPQPIPSYSPAPVSPQDPTVVRPTAPATSRRTKKVPPSSSASRSSVPGRTGAGKTIFGLLLLLIPIVVAVAAHQVKDQVKLNDLLDRIEGIAHRGFRKFEERLMPISYVPSPPPKVVDRKPVKPPDLPARPKDARTELEEKIQAEWSQMAKIDKQIADFSQNPTGPEKRMKADLEVRREAVQKRYDDFQAEYKKAYGAEFKPK